MYAPTNDIKISQRIGFGVGLMPPNLTQHAVGEGVVTLLGTQRRVSEAISVDSSIKRWEIAYSIVRPIMSIVYRKVMLSR